MFYRQQSDQYINENTAFTIDGVQYPSNWLNLTSAADKEALGLVEVTTVGERKDERYYWVGETLEGAVRTIVNTPKELDDVKKNATTQVNQMAFSILQPTDFVEIRNLKDPTYKADHVTWRASIVTYCNTITAAIEAATDVDQVAEAVSSINWPQEEA